MTDLDLGLTAGTTTIAGRTIWTLCSQGLSSVGNVAVVVLAARALSVGGFGELSVALAAYSIGLGVSRALLSDPLMVRSSATAEAVARRLGSAALSAALLVTGALGVLALGCHLLGVPAVSASLATLGLILPLVLGQDLLRHVAFVLRRPAVAAGMDLLWLLATVGGLLLVPKGAGPHMYLAVWGIAAGVAAMVGALVLRVAPGRGALAQLRSTRGLSASAAGEFLCLAGASQGVILVVAIMGEPVLAGSLRAAGVLLGPVGILANGAHAAIVAEGSRSRANGLSGLRTAARTVPLGLAVTVAVWALLLSHLPDHVGRFLLGDTWPDTSVLLVRYGLVFAGLVAATELGAVLRAVDQIGRAFVAAAPMLVCSVVAAVVLSGRGSSVLMFGLIVAVSVGVVLYGWQVHQVLRRPPSGSGPGVSDLAHDLATPS